MSNYDIIVEPNGPLNPRDIIPIMSDSDIDMIQTCDCRTKKYEPGEEEYKNIFIKYFHNMDITEEDLNFLEEIDMTPTWQLFYNMLWLIFCLDYYTNKLLN